MKTLVNNLLQELNYKYIEPFEFDAKNISCAMYWFVSESYDAQSCIVCHMEAFDFVNIDEEQFFPGLASVYRQNNQYRSDYNKNTTIIFCIDTSSGSAGVSDKQVSIEDNPYYFKKYVFSYTKKQLNKFQGLKDDLPQKSYIELIQEYISDAEKFDKFKENPTNQELYSFVSNLMIKIPGIPIKVSGEETLKEVLEYYNSEEFKDDEYKLEKIVECLMADENNEHSVVEQILKIWEGVDNA